MADVQLEMKAWPQQDKGRERSSKAGQNQHVQRKEQTLLQQAKDKLVKTLPVFNSIDVNDLKARGLALWIAAVHLALYLAVGLYFISTVTSREYVRKFLSPSFDVSSVCEKIPVAVTGTYLADKSGVWETSKAFDVGSPLYELALTGSKITEEQYTRVMQNFTAQLQAYGKKTASLDVVGSQIAWSLFRASDADAMMVLESYAQLGQIFAEPSFSAPFEFCPEQITASVNTFGLRDSLTHSFGIDLVSAVTAFALNFGIINTTSLTKTWSLRWDVGGDVGYVVEVKWMDERYPQMQPVTCYSKTGAPRVCFVSIAETFAYPIIYLDGIGQACMCPQDEKSEFCNLDQTLRLSLVFPKNKRNSLNTFNIFNAGIGLQRTIQAGPDGPNSVIKLVSRLASTAHYLRKYPRIVYDEWRNQGEAVDGVMPYSQFAADFKTLGTGISIFAVDLFYDGGGANFNSQGVTLASLTETHFNMSVGGWKNVTVAQVMCTDTIFQPRALQQMALAPPVPVIQPYLSCHPTLNSAFVTAAGIAAANSALVSSIFLGLAVFLTVQYFNNFSSGGGGGGRIVAPADKALRAAETDEILLANDDKHFANDASLRAEVKALSSELAAIKALLTRQQVLELSQQWLNTAPRPHSRPAGIAAADGAFGGENPLHPQSGPSGVVVLPAARLSPTGAIAAAATPAAAVEEQTDRI